MPSSCACANASLISVIWRVDSSEQSISSRRVRRLQVVRFLDGSKQHLIELVRQRQQLVVIDLYDERNLVRVFAADDAEYAERRGDCVAPAFDREFHDVFRIEVLRVRRERSARGVFDALVDGKN